MSFTTWPWRHWRAERGEAIALCTAREHFTWRQLCERVDALAAGFHQQGVREGAGVALCAKNSPQALFAWLALLQCGVRVLPLNPQLPAPMLAQLLPALSLDYALVCG
ncbi:AMP-binding protein, partial [Franconibacter pulveris]|uniref:AMP-binding protein n=1 Tax=Franconibacter pulveris TaxID=435910 RepID=UPI0004A2D4E5